MDSKDNDHFPPATEMLGHSSAHIRERAARDWTDRLEAALMKVAALLDRDPAFGPVFERLEAELEAARRAQEGTDAQRRARALLDQRASRASSSALRSKDAPLP